MQNISASYSCQFKIMHFICSLNYISLFFYHYIIRINMSKQYRKNRNVGTVLVIRKTRKQLTTHSQFCIKIGRFHYAQSILLNFD